MPRPQGHSIDDYLETIYFLAFPIGEYRPASGTAAIASRVAEMLGVSRASAGEMLKRLEGEGLVERGEQKEAILTSTGAERARRVVRKHRIIERFLTDFMGYTAAESHVHADELGDTFSDEMIERINERLGRPDRCPHGWPVEPDVEQRENAGLVALADLAPGQHGEIVRLAEHDGELLEWFYDEGFAPGARVALREAQPAAGQFKVALDGDERSIADRAAQGLYVRVDSRLSLCSAVSAKVCGWRRACWGSTTSPRCGRPSRAPSAPRATRSRPRPTAWPRSRPSPAPSRTRSCSTCSCPAPTGSR